MWSKSLNVYVILALQLLLLCDATSSTSSTDSEGARGPPSTLQQAHGGREDGLHALPDGFNNENQQLHSVGIRGKSEMPQTFEGVALRQDPLGQYGLALQLQAPSRAVVGASSHPTAAWWRQYRARYNQPLPYLFGRKFTPPNPTRETLQYFGYGDRVAELNFLRKEVLKHRRYLLTPDDAQRLQHPFHSWKSVPYEAASSRAREYQSLIEAEKMYVLEVERILERVAKTPH